MILDQFNKTGFRPNMLFKYRDDKVYVATGVDFEEQLIELQLHEPDKEDNGRRWVRYENVDLIKD